MDQQTEQALAAHMQLIMTLQQQVGELTQRLEHMRERIDSLSGPTGFSRPDFGGRL